MDKAGLLGNLIEDVGDPLADLALKQGVDDQDGNQDADQWGSEQEKLAVGDGEGRIDHYLQVMDHGLEDDPGQTGQKAHHDTGQDQKLRPGQPGVQPVDEQ